MWQQTVKFFNLLQLSMHQREPGREELRRHEVLATTLLAIGTLIRERITHLGENDLRILEALGLTEGSLAATLRDVKDSYETWHTEVSQTDVDAIRATFSGATR